MEQYEREKDTFQEDENVIRLGTLLFHMWKGVLKFWWLIPIMIGLCSTLGYYKFKRQFVPMYQAKGIFTVAASQGNQNEASGNSNSVSTYDRGTVSQIAATFPYVIQSEIFQEVLCEALGTSVVNGYISVEATENTNLFTMITISNSAEDAYNILIAAMENYPKVAKYVIGDTTLNVLQKPIMPEVSYNSFSSVKSSVIKYGLLGFMIALLPIGFYAVSRREIHTQEDIRRYLNLPYLGAVSKIRIKRRSKKQLKLLDVGNTKIDPVFSETMKRISSKIVREMEKENGQVLLVTSTNPDEGKTMSSTNIAKTLVTQGKKVVLIHGDIRKPENANTYKEDEYKQLITNFFENPKDSIVKVKQALDKNQLFELAMIKKVKHPIQFIQSDDMREMIESLKEIADYVVIDSPPVGLMVDAIIFAHYADGAVYVVRQDYMNRGQILNALSSLSTSQCKIYGCMLNYATEKQYI